MRDIALRPAGPADARDIAAMLSGVLATADTSAIAGPVGGDTIRRWMASAPDRARWTVAEDAAGAILGLQWIEPHALLPPEAADIATFVVPGRRQVGIGSALFAVTEAAARDLGYGWINATIRADNAGGIVYYRSRGFRPWKTETDVEIRPGKRVDRIAMRYDLD